MSCGASETEHCETEDLWKVYFHDPDERDWTHASYRMLAQISSAAEFNGVHAEIVDLLPRGMFFLMREHVFPAWDDRGNIEGGCLCMKIPKPAVSEFWRGACAAIMGETVVRPEHRDAECVVNGVSVSPKNHFCIVKLWISTDAFAEGARFFQLPPFDGQMLYKANNAESQRFASEAAK